MILACLFRDSYPTRPQFLPSLGFELLGVFAIEFFPAVHGVQRPLHSLAFGDEEGGFAVITAAEGENGVNLGAAGVACYYWVESECCHIFQSYSSSNS